MKPRTPLGRFLGALLVWSGLLAQSAFAVQSDKFTKEERAWIVANPVVMVGVRTDVAPLEYTVNGQLRGLSAEYLKAVSRLTGLKVEIREINDRPTSVSGWLKDGIVDMFALAVRNIRSPSDPSDSLFTAPYYVSATIIVTQTGAPLMVDVGELDGQTVAVPRYSVFETKFREVLPKARIITGDGAVGTLELVATGKADAAIGLDGFLSPLMSGRYAGILQVSGVISSVYAELSMAVSSDRPMLYSILQKALQQITAEESYRMNEAWLEQVRFGEPSLGVLVRHYSQQGLLLSGVCILLGGLAYIWRREHRRAVRGEGEKAMFLAVMSHEIRSPMNAVLASVELLQRTPLDSEQRRLVGLAHDGGGALLRLLNDVLDITKLEAGKFVLEFEPTDIAALAREVAEFFRAQAEEKGIELVAMLPDSCGMLLLDAPRTTQILHNLVSNAIRFTPTGSVTITVAFLPHEDCAPDGVLRIEVADTGIGIDESAQSRLFQSYAQMKKAIRRRDGGTGLGLLICRELVTRMNGHISVHSLLGTGTTVTLSLPVTNAAASEGTPKDAGLPAASSEFDSAAILLVEDTPANQFVIQAQLDRLGCKVRLAADGAQAMLAFQQANYDLVLMDCDLPDTDGYTLARKFRALEAAQGASPCSIIAISAISGSTHTLQCLNAGMDGVLSKPIRLAKLQSTIENLCGVSLTEPNEESPVSAPAPPTMDAHIALGFVQEDLSMVDAAWAEGDVSRAKHHAHRLRGASMSLGLLTLSRLATGLEELLDSGPDMDAEDVLQVIKDADLELRRIIAAAKGAH